MTLLLSGRRCNDIKNNDQVDLIGREVDWNGLDWIGLNEWIDDAFDSFDSIDAFD